MIKVGVFTGTRAEYGLMKTLIQALNDDYQFELNLFVSSTHLSDKFGNTIEEIKSDGIKPKYLVPIFIKSSKNKDMAYQTADTIKGVSDILDKNKLDYFIVLGDRYETFGAATAAHLLGIKIIHLHGGEETLGAIDDRLRNAITQLSSFHFTSAEIHKEKVQQLIGSRSNVFNIGPMVLDALLNFKFITKKDFSKNTGYVFSKKNILFTYHPETLSSDFGLSNLKNLLNILEDYECNILFTRPNSDVGSDLIMELINEFINKKISNRFFIPSLGQNLYLNALNLFRLVVGNSSSGIIEAPLLKCNVLNVGDRQKGRYRFGKIINADSKLSTIASGVTQLFNRPLTDFEYHKFKNLNKDKSPTQKILTFLKNN